ncbi:hypothetical protein BDV59DRAFT_75749 [Aspergillus ambiguus]|uniref:uncharacterized protein n=1 Tax=Aspergillus ambiguus TaxID=176160 RepID=UPI003CCCD03A
MSDSSQPRHWHGSVGDRYEHTNVWVRGGPPTSYRRPSTSAVPATASASTISNDMNDRRSSAASDVSASASSSANTGSSPPGRRRSSGHGPSTLFESLTSQKRSAEDPSVAARRASYTEQAQKGGFFSKWWDGYTRGQ